ncbi:MAG: hypothetical protein K1X63_09800 [Chitinophagales bacterium]|nr:hypothetical protein [Chitinophagales bacterium]
MAILKILVLFFILKLLEKMGLIDELKSLPLWQKAIVVSVAILLCFWFAIFYVFNAELVELPFYKSLLIIVVPSLVWYGLELAKLSIGVQAMRKGANINPKGLEFWVMVLIDGIVYLILIFLILYFSKITLRNFMIVAFSIELLQLIVLLILKKGLVKFFRKLSHESNRNQQSNS